MTTPLMMAAAPPGLYRGTVIHQRLRPRRHRLRYQLFMLLLDLDDLPALNRFSPLLRHEGPAFMSFRNRDHGPATGAELRPWVEARLREAGVTDAAGPVRLLCLPRIFGYVFNPLSVYFCHRADGRLTAALYEVCNTRGERHTYVIPAGNGGKPVMRQSCAKQMYVSPFTPLQSDYHFRVLPPGDRISVVIRQDDADGPLLAASFSGTRLPLNRGTLARALLRFPLATFKVTAAIHWEALVMWLRGFSVFPYRRAQARVGSSVGRAEE